MAYRHQCLEMDENVVGVVRYTTQTRLGSNKQKGLEIRLLVSSRLCLFDRWKNKCSVSE